MSVMTDLRRLSQAAEAVIASSHIDLSAEGVSSVARVPAKLMTDLMQALNAIPSDLRKGK